MTCVILFCGCLRRLLSFCYLALRAPDRGVSAWKVRAGRSVSSPWPGKVRRHLGFILFGFGARHRRRQHHLVSSSRCPAPVNRLSLLWAPFFTHFKKTKIKGSGGWGVLSWAPSCGALSPTCAILLLDSGRGSCLSSFSCVTSVFRCGFLVSHIKPESTAQWAARRCLPPRE